MTNKPSLITGFQQVFGNFDKAREEMVKVLIETGYNVLDSVTVLKCNSIKYTFKLEDRYYPKFAVAKIYISPQTGVYVTDVTIPIVFDIDDNTRMNSITDLNIILTSILNRGLSIIDNGYHLTI